MRHTKNLSFALLVTVLGFTLAGCQTDTPTVTTETQTTGTSNFDDWTDETHSKNVDPNYEVVFPQEAVNRLDIVIAADEWQAMLDNMTDLYGDASSRSNVEGGGNAARPERGQAVAGEVERERPEPGVG